MPFGQPAHGVVEQREPVAEPGQDVVERHGPQPGGGQFERQGQVVEPVRQGQRPVPRPGRRRAAGPHAGFEQGERLVVGQRRQPVDDLAEQAQRRPAGGEHAEPGRRHGQQLGHDVRDGAEDVLAVVEHEQPVEPGAEGPQPFVGPERAAVRGAGVRAAQYREHGGQHLGGRAQAGQLDHPHGLGGTGDLGGQPGLPGPAGGDDGHHRRLPQRLSDGGEIRLAPDQRRHRPAPGGRQPAGPVRPRRQLPAQQGEVRVGEQG